MFTNQPKEKTVKRTLTAHIVEGDSVNHQLGIVVFDEPGSGGACHEYGILRDPALLCGISFQNGPIKEVGVNGITHEALLAILIDRMEGFQAGPFASDDNAKALTNMKVALGFLQKRTRDRMARGVEGTHTV